MCIVKPYLKARKSSKKILNSGKKANRSSKRTDVLNKEMKSFLEKNYFKQKDGYTIKCEEAIPCSYGRSFKVDVLVYKDEELFMLFHLKAIESSYNKNRNNYGGIPIGETSRVYDHKSVPKNLHSVWLDWIPNSIPVYNKNGDIMHWESPNPADLSMAEQRWNKTLEKDNSSVSYIKIRFDYDSKNHTAKNISGFNKLNNYLRSIV